MPIRGGTDGSILSARGLPTPNLFTGGHGYHSVREWASVQDMASAAAVAVRLAGVGRSTRTDDALATTAVDTTPSLWRSAAARARDREAVGAVVEDSRACDEPVSCLRTQCQRVSWHASRLKRRRGPGLTVAAAVSSRCAPAGDPLGHRVEHQAGVGHGGAAARRQRAQALQRRGTPSGGSRCGSMRESARAASGRTSRPAPGPGCRSTRRGARRLAVRAEREMRELRRPRAAAGRRW